MKLETKLLIAGEKNLNGRVYSPEALRDIARQFEKIKPVFGEIEPPPNKSVVSLKNVSHKINSIRIKKSRLPRKKKKLLKKQGLYESWKNNNGQVLFGEIELLNTPHGELAKKMFKDKSVVVRPRGFGNVNDGKIKNYSLTSFDIINKNNDSFNGLI